MKALNTNKITLNLNFQCQINPELSCRYQWVQEELKEEEEEKEEDAEKKRMQKQYTICCIGRYNNMSF